MRPRLDSIDLVRGIAMVLMALDHVRDYFGAPGPSPTDLGRASAALFLTRWITHLCAPTFFLLAGVGAYLALERMTRPALQRFLLARGLWLVLLELTVVRCLGYQFNFDYQVTLLVILWALGWSMVALAPLLALPPAWVAGIGVAMIASHNLLDAVPARAFGALAPLWSILHAPGFVAAPPGPVVFVAYPLVPWIGVMAAGFGLGQLYAWQSERRRSALLRWGAALTAAFFVLRLANLYGDPSRWSAQRDSLFTALSFLNATKYPPSLLFLLMTLGPALLLLAWAERGTPRALEPARVLGRVPLFYFLLHLPLIHLLAVGLCYARHGEAHWMFESPSLDRYPFKAPPGWGVSLGTTYLVWFVVVAALYPACRAFATLKQRRADGWLRYF
jgi:uncharacterized membrane protein